MTTETLTLSEGRRIVQERERWLLPSELVLLLPEVRAEATAAANELRVEAQKTIDLKLSRDLERRADLIEKNAVNELLDLAYPGEQHKAAAALHEAGAFASR